ncbi:DUF1996 domain-containing protein [Actinophytocola sp.]|uniref:DUF1996 domain-containing protein n=1 Tax=Actinophytocola sp. TaxID=1872138 RepID=UPI002ED866DC
MPRHQMQRRTRRRLTVAGVAAMAIIGTTVAVGIIGNASARQAPVVNPVCLPEQPPASQTAPPPASSSPAESSPAQTAPPASSSAAGQPPAEQPPAQQPPSAQPPSSAQPPAQNPGMGTPPSDPMGMTAPAAAHPRHPKPVQQPAAQPEQPAGNPAADPAAGAPAQNPAAGAPAQVPPDPTAAPPVDPNAGKDPAAAPDESGDAPPVQAPEPPAGAPEDQFGNPQCADPIGPSAEDYINIRNVAPVNMNARPGRGASRGSFVASCGQNENGHRNPDNFIVAPGVRNGAHHTHDYVGNLTADANSTNESLAAAGTTCRGGDLSTYYWPVIRIRAAAGQNEVVDEENPHNQGTILAPARAQLTFKGNATGPVVAMPQFIRIITGDAKASTNGGANANAKWTCTGFENRITTKYPLCPRGSSVQRILDFPSCWDGQNIDSANHRNHIKFPDASGTCAPGTQAVPALQMRLTYNVPRGGLFVLDSFPDEKHNPVTDHGDFVNVMPAPLMDRVVRCVNQGRRC